MKSWNNVIKFHSQSEMKIWKILVRFGAVSDWFHCLMSNFGPCPMSLAATFRNTTKIVDDQVINQSLGAIDDGMWWCYFGDGAMSSKIFVFSYAGD